MNKFIIYTDGGARGNPGPAGVGVYITDSKGKEIKKVSHYLGKQTNNFAEYEAVVLALQTLKKIVKKADRKNIQVEIKTDSELVKKQLNGEYQIKEKTLFPQFIKIWNMRVAEFPNISFTHIPRGQNKIADELANIAMDKKS